MSSPLFPPELFILVGINLFIALSLLFSIFDRFFPSSVSYIYQIAALAGFGELWVNYTFLVSLEARFWCSVIYLIVALVNLVAVNIYLADKRSSSVAGAFFGVATVPTVFLSFFGISAYVNGLAVYIPPLPLVPMESLYLVFFMCIIILGVSITASVKPKMLTKMFRRRKRGFAPNLLHYAQPQRITQQTEKEVKMGG
jgi:hypothetical protein